MASSVAPRRGGRRAAQTAEMNNAMTNKWWVDDATCLICTDKISVRGVPFECRVHAFCYECIMMWVKQTPTCPICRASITRVLACRTAQEVLTANWRTVRPIKLRRTVRQTLAPEAIEAIEAVVEDAEDDSFDSQDAAEGESSETESSIHTEGEDDADEHAGSDESSQSSENSVRMASSFWNDDLSREPTFTGRREDDGSSEREEIAFSLVPGEEHIPHNTAHRTRDKDYVPSGGELDSLRGADDARPATRSSSKRRRSSEAE